MTLNTCSDVLWDLFFLWTSSCRNISLYLQFIIFTESGFVTGCPLIHLMLHNKYYVAANGFVICVIYSHVYNVIRFGRASDNILYLTVSSWNHGQDVCKKYHPTYAFSSDVHIGGFLSGPWSLCVWLLPCISPINVLIVYAYHDNWFAE